MTKYFEEDYECTQVFDPNGITGAIVTVREHMSRMPRLPLATSLNSILEELQLEATG